MREGCDRHAIMLTQRPCSKARFGQTWDIRTKQADCAVKGFGTSVCLFAIASYMPVNTSSHKLNGTGKSVKYKKMTHLTTVFEIFYFITGKRFINNIGNMP